jgi:hypothetical protein
MPPPQPLNLPPLRAVPPQNHATLRTSFLRLLAALAFCNNDNETAAALPLSLARLACFGARAGMPWSLASVFGAAVARFLPHRAAAPPCPRARV